MASVTQDIFIKAVNILIVFLQCTVFIPPAMLKSIKKKLNTNTVKHFSSCWWNWLLLFILKLTRWAASTSGCKNKAWPAWLSAHYTKTSLHSCMHSLFWCKICLDKWQKWCRGVEHLWKFVFFSSYNWLLIFIHHESTLTDDDNLLTLGGREMIWPQAVATIYSITRPFRNVNTNR